MRRRWPALLLSSSILAGCLRDDLAADGTAPPAPPKPAPSAVTNTAPDLAPIEPDATMPGPRRLRLGAAVARNATCESCHLEEADAWRASRHHQAATNDAYRAALAIEPTPFCRGCHAPESNPTQASPQAVLDLGVGCVTCHVTEEGTVLAAEPEGSGKGISSAPHTLKRSRAFATSFACAGCHEFSFPGRHGDSDGDLMQTTVTEHRNSPAAGASCASCHMPLRGGRRSHAFAEVRDPAWLRANLRATATIDAHHTVRITLTQPAPGHAFPTGDLFRGLEIGCEARDAAGRVLRREVRHLARHFEIVPGRQGRHLVRDDRVFDAPVTIEMPLAIPSPPPKAARVAYWVTYQRVATVGTGTRPEDVKIESEVQLHSGALPWDE
ncbi:Cytochrome C553 [Minicystis rosea]|nr:Cytochrome C553 [Minicystis rosea]